MKNVMLFFSLLISSNLMAQNVIGDWHGALDVQGMQLRIVFHIMEDGEQLKSTMDSPDQGAAGIPMDKTIFENGELTIEASALRAKYSAKFSDDNSTLEGTFNQAGMSFPLKLSKEKMEKKAVNRPQEPKVFPYQQEEVKFQNPKGEHHLAGTLTKPMDDDFEKVVVLISGSGPQDRNEELLNHKPFLVLSDYLTRHGIAVLRYDDRGVAASGGKYKGATSQDFADDAAAAVVFLKNRKDMKGKKIGLAGHSEGGMIAPIVASENSDVDFIVLLAGPGIPIDELMLLQTDKIAEAEGASSAQRKVNANLSVMVFDYLKNSNQTDKASLEKGLMDVLDKGYATLTEDQKKEMGSKEELFSQQKKMILDDWFLYFMKFDPADFLEKVKCPVLAVNGEFDLQVTAKENLEGIQKSLEKGGNKNFMVREFSGLNHLFQKTKTGAPSEYPKLEETFNEDVMKFVSDWIQKL